MRNEVFNILPLTIKKKWFDMILSGEKKEEYREIKPFYDSRFSNTLGYPTNIIKAVFEQQKSEQFLVKFINGYSKNSPSFIADCRLSIGTGKEEWGAEKDTIYYVIHVEKIRWKSMDNLGGYLTI